MEQGGCNLYAFCLNEPVAQWDVGGLGDGPAPSDFSVGPNGNLYYDYGRVTNGGQKFVSTTYWNTYTPDPFSAGANAIYHQNYPSPTNSSQGLFSSNGNNFQVDTSLAGSVSQTSTDNGSSAQGSAGIATGSDPTFSFNSTLPAVNNLTISGISFAPPVPATDSNTTISVGSTNSNLTATSPTSPSLTVAAGTSIVANTTPSSSGTSPTNTTAAPNNATTGPSGPAGNITVSAGGGSAPNGLSYISGGAAASFSVVVPSAFGIVSGGFNVSASSVITTNGTAGYSFYQFSVSAGPLVGVGGAANLG